MISFSGGYNEFVSAEPANDACPGWSLADPVPTKIKLNRKTTRRLAIRIQDPSTFANYNATTPALPHRATDSAWESNAEHWRDTRHIQRQSAYAAWVPRSRLQKGERSTRPELRSPGRAHRRVTTPGPGSLRVPRRTWDCVHCDSVRLPRGASGETSAPAYRAPAARTWQMNQAALGCRPQ